MNSEEKFNIISAIPHPLTDASFYSSFFSAMVKKRKEDDALSGDNLKKVCLEEYDSLSKRLDLTLLQESCSVRNVLKTRRLANLLINDKGDLNVSVLVKVTQLIQDSLYSLGPNRHYDALRQEHLLKTLKKLRDSKELARLLKMIGKPISNPLADQIIRETLQIPPGTAVTDAHARRAALSALMCYLRQNVGSCFATAPAIVIHDEQPEQFLKDINELLSTSRLKRTYGGVEYSVPFSPSWGAGDLRRLIPLGIIREQEEKMLANSPGIIAALEAAGILPEELAMSEKVEKTMGLLDDWIATEPHLDFIAVEDVLKHLILRHCGLTLQDLTDFENRPKAMMQSSLMQVVQTTSGSGGIGEACNTFLALYEKALNAFKALADNALLKAWEFTLASFAENKAGFTTWNLYSSLGLGSSEEGGIGACIFKVLQKKLDETNQKVKDLQTEYEQIYGQVKFLEGRIRGASTEKEAQWMRAEYQSKANEFYTFEELRDKTNEKARRYANLFSELMQTYIDMFPRYFQEVYDADIHEFAGGPYDDSPAGFRLLYKFGRLSTSQWLRIKNPNEFIDALANFFTASENEISMMPEFEGLREDLGEVVTAVVSHIRTKEFIETAFYRMAKAHQTPLIKNPLEHLDKIEKKPWVYTSGGTMDNLVCTYYRREQKLTFFKRWVENPSELLVFFIDIVKQTPAQVTDEFVKCSQKSMLMESPTHAFLFKPGYSPFKEAWQNDAFTYTWVRDQLIKPMQRFIDNQILTEEVMDYLLNQLRMKIPINFHPRFKEVFKHVHGTMGIQEFRNYVLDKISHDKGFKIRGQGILSPDAIDSILYNLAPLFSISELEERVRKILANVWDNYGKNKSNESIEQILSLTRGARIFSAQDLQNICKMIICFEEKTSTAKNYDLLISRAAQSEGYAMPAPIIFADTNWVKEDFAFVVNPGTGQLELWRIDYIGRYGTPMSIWKQWVNGSKKDPQWGLYPRPYEYTPAKPLPNLPFR